MSILDIDPESERRIREGFEAIDRAEGVQKPPQKISPLDKVRENRETLEKEARASAIWNPEPWKKRGDSIMADETEQRLNDAWEHLAAGTPTPVGRPSTPSTPSTPASPAQSTASTRIGEAFRSVGNAIDRHKILTEQGYDALKAYMENGVLPTPATRSPEAVAFGSGAQTSVGKIESVKDFLQSVEASAKLTFNEKIEAADAERPDLTSGQVNREVKRLSEWINKVTDAGFNEVSNLSPDVLKKGLSKADIEAMADRILGQSKFKSMVKKAAEHSASRAFRTPEGYFQWKRVFALGAITVIGVLSGAALGGAIGYFAGISAIKLANTLALAGGIFGGGGTLAGMKFKNAANRQHVHDLLRAELIDSITKASGVAINFLKTKEKGGTNVPGIEVEPSKIIKAATAALDEIRHVKNDDIEITKTLLNRILSGKYGTTEELKAKTLKKLFELDTEDSVPAEIKMAILKGDDVEASLMATKFAGPIARDREPSNRASRSGGSNKSGRTGNSENMSALASLEDGLAGLAEAISSGSLTPEERKRASKLNASLFSLGSAVSKVVTADGEAAEEVSSISRRRNQPVKGLGGQPG